MEDFSQKPLDKLVRKIVAKLDEAVEKAYRSIANVDPGIALGMKGIADGERIIIVSNTLTGAKLVLANPDFSAGKTVYFQKPDGEREYRADNPDDKQWNQKLEKFLETDPAIAFANQRLRWDRMSGEPMKTDRDREVEAEQIARDRAVTTEAVPPHQLPRNEGGTDRKESFAK